MRRRRSGKINCVETERDYLDVEIGRAIMGEPVRTLEQTAAAIGISKQGAFYAERRLLRKIGRFARRLIEREMRTELRRVA